MLVKGGADHILGHTLRHDGEERYDQGRWHGIVATVMDRAAA